MGGIPPEIVRLATGREGAPTDEELREILQNLPGQGPATKAGKRDDPPPATLNVNNQPQVDRGPGIWDAGGTASPILPDGPQDAGGPAAASWAPPPPREDWTPSASPEPPQELPNLTPGGNDARSSPGASSTPSRSPALATPRASASPGCFAMLGRRMIPDSGRSRDRRGGSQGDDAERDQPWGALS